MSLNESTVEDAALGWFGELGYGVKNGIPEEAREEASRKVLRATTTSLVQANRAFHRLLRRSRDC